MKKISLYKIAFTGIVACLTFAACEKEIEMDLRSVEPRLVIEGLVPLDETAKVSITKTKDYNSDNNYPAIEGATVVIRDDAGNYEELQFDESGWYLAQNIRGVEGRTYFLEIEVEGKELSSVSTMPYTVKMDSIDMYYIPAFKEAFPRLIFDDPEGVDNYYRHRLYINSDIKVRTIFTSSDEDRDGKRIRRILPYESEEYDDYEIQKGDTITIETYCLDKGAYDFFDTLAMIGFSLANPTSNIQGDALGYFSAYTLETISAIADWEE